MGGLELLGLLGGALTRLFTWFAEYQQKKQDNEHELAMIDKQIALSKVQHEQKLEEINTQSNANIDAEWAKSLSVALEPIRSGVGFIDGLNALVRPLLTVWWCLFLYSVYKAFILYSAITAKYTAIQLASVIVTDFDISIIGAIIGFWFVNRAIAQGKK